MHNTSKEIRGTEKNQAKAVAKAEGGELNHREENHPVTIAEIETALGDLRKLTESGIVE